MKHLKIAGLCLVSMLVVGMALAGNASAAPLWLLCLKEGTSGVAPTKYESNQCTKTNTALEGEWQSAGLPSGGSDTVRLLGFSVRLGEANGIAIECPDAFSGWGLIKEGKKGIIKSEELVHPEAEGCKLLNPILTCKSIGNITKIEGTHLPWSFEIFTTENKDLTNIEGTGGEPGWDFECGGFGVTCAEKAGEPEYLELVNGVTRGVLLVLGRFEGKRKENCLSGSFAFLLWNGSGLSITTL